MVADSSTSSQTTTVTLASLLVGTVAVAWMLLQRRGSNMSGERQKGSTATKGETWESKIPKNYGPLKEIWTGCLYVLEADGTNQGPPVRNMTIYRPPKERRLVIYNGIAVREETLNVLLALGEPTVLVVPNSMHRDCASVWKNRFPKLIVVTPEVAVAQASEVVPVDMTTQVWAKSPEWNKVVTALEIDGIKPFETILEFDLGSNKKAFVVTDLLFTLRYCGKGLLSRFMNWIFDSYVVEPLEGGMVIPKISRITRWFGIADWPNAERWYRTYAKSRGSDVAVVCVGHGPPIIESHSKDGCTVALDGVADQLVKPRW